MSTTRNPLVAELIEAIKIEAQSVVIARGLPADDWHCVVSFRTLAAIEALQTEMHPLAELGAALACVAGHIADAGVCAALGPAQANELASVASGYRQRFPQHWPAGDAGKGGAA